MKILDSITKCNHQFRPLISKDLVDCGYGSDAATIGMSCGICGKEEIWYDVVKRKPKIEYDKIPIEKFLHLL